MTGENIEVQAKEEIAPFSIRYFVHTDSDGYVTGMMVAVSEQEKAIKSALLAEANTNTQPWQTQLLLGIISEEDKISLINWMMYYKKVQEIDASVAPNISWPDKP